MGAKRTTEPMIEPHAAHWVSRTAFSIITVTFFVTQAALVFAAYRGAYWLAVPLVLLSSHLMHGMLIGLHEAAHRLLRKNRLLNEVDGIIIGVFSFTSFNLFRAVHQSHHAHFTSERDEEFWPFVSPAASRPVRILAAVLELGCRVAIYSSSISPCVFAQWLINSQKERAPAHLG
jgi:fatty acid desaturase